MFINKETIKESITKQEIKMMFKRKRKKKKRKKMMKMNIKADIKMDIMVERTKINILKEIMVKKVKRMRKSQKSLVILKAQQSLGHKNTVLGRKIIKNQKITYTMRRIKRKVMMNMKSMVKLNKKKNMIIK